MNARDHHAAVARLVDAFGATVVVNMRVTGSRVMVLDLNDPAGPSRQSARMRDSALRSMDADPDEMLFVEALGPRGVDPFIRAGVGFVLALGAHACAAWRGDVPLTRAAGKMYGWRGRVYVYPMLHMNAVLRGSVTLTEWRRDLGTFLELTVDTDPLHQSRHLCVECGHELFMLDADAVPWCSDHYNRHVKRSLAPQGSGSEQLRLA